MTEPTIRISPDAEESNNEPVVRRRGRGPGKAASQADGIVQQRLAWVGAGATLVLSVIILGISMPHLIAGVAEITNCGLWTAVWMGCVFDLSQIAAEYSIIVLPLLAPQRDRRVTWVATLIMIACTCVSITMNVRAFVINADNTFESMMAYAWGTSLPILVLLFCFIASFFILRIAQSTNRGEDMSLRMVRWVIQGCVCFGPMFVSGLVMLAGGQTEEAVETGIVLLVMSLLWFRFCGSLRWWLTCVLLSRLVKKLTCQHCGLVIDAVGRWNIGQYHDHKERHVYRVKSPLDGKYLGWIDCPKCEATIVL